MSLFHPDLILKSFRDGMDQPLMNVAVDSPEWSETERRPWCGHKHCTCGDALPLLLAQSDMLFFAIKYAI